MIDPIGRHINYLRISVTDRCNLRCLYCMPESGIDLISHNDLLSFEEIVEVVKAGAKLGINKIRITGGEPLVRKGIVDLIKQISFVDEINDVSMTTNGILLRQFANPLKAAGLNRVNISLDTLNADRFRSITRIGNLTQTLEGIEEARKVGLSPIKINCVIKESQFEKDAQMVAKFCIKNNLQVRFIREMNLQQGSFSKVIGGEGGNCNSCNRLRLTSTGKLKPCLFDNLSYDIRKLGIFNAFEHAISNKPLSGSINNYNSFSNIGG